jgi:hypothetical protein
LSRCPEQRMRVNRVGAGRLDGEPELGDEVVVVGRPLGAGGDAGHPDPVPDEQGRHLGGRLPYGFRLVDAGPHPNRVHARWGRRLHRLDPDPVTAPHVRWIFARRLAGDSAAGIARTLNERQVPSPSAYDPDRNRHRVGTEWTLRTVAEILTNPRYTGRQVWNRQRTDRHETVPATRTPAWESPGRGIRVASG